MTETGLVSFDALVVAISFGAVSFHDLLLTKSMMVVSFHDLFIVEPTITWAVVNRIRICNAFISWRYKYFPLSTSKRNEDTCLFILQTLTTIAFHEYPKTLKYRIQASIMLMPNWYLIKKLHLHPNRNLRSGSGSQYRIEHCSWNLFFLPYSLYWVKQIFWGSFHLRKPPTFHKKRKYWIYCNWLFP